MNRDRLLALGYTLGDRAAGGRSGGAWFATTAEGAPVVLKWFPDETMAERYDQLLPSLQRLRSRGVPVPDYLQISRFEGGLLAVQQFLPGRSQNNPSMPVIDELIELISAQSGLSGPPPNADHPTWGGFVVDTLTGGQPGWASHEPLLNHGLQGARLLARIKTVGGWSDPSCFPTNGLVHLDLHTDNILIENDAVAGIIDWEGACAGDYRYDLIQLAFDLDGHHQPIWKLIDSTDFDATVLKAYLALLALKCTASAVCHHPEDVPRQLDRADRIFSQFGIE